MILDEIKKFCEATRSVLDDVLDGWLTPKAVEEANAIYKPLEASREGQLQILDAAKSGDEKAIVYLYKKYLPLVQKVFWKYFVGPNKEYGKSKLQPEAAYDFIMAAYELLSDKNETSPYKTFNPDKFTDRTNIVTQFSYYFYRYLQNEAIQLAKSLMKGGMSHASFNSEGSEDNTSVSSYEDYLDNSTETATEDHSNTSDLKIMFDDFRKWLVENKEPKYVTTWDMKSRGLSMQDVADELNLPSEQYARVLWNKIKAWFIERYPDARDYM